jgi:hypothetical protein
MATSVRSPSRRSYKQLLSSTPSSAHLLSNTSEHTDLEDYELGFTDEAPSPQSRGSAGSEAFPKRDLNQPETGERNHNFNLSLLESMRNGFDTCLSDIAQSVR